MANTLTPEHELVLRAQEFGRRTADMCRAVVETQWYEEGIKPERGLLQTNYERAVQLLCSESQMTSHRTIIGLLIDGIDRSLVPDQILDMATPYLGIMPVDTMVSDFCRDLGNILRVPEYGYTGLKEPDTIHVST
jgi:hypothetical protein